jgi:hypothetical protein
VEAAAAHATTPHVAVKVGLHSWVHPLAHTPLHHAGAHFRSHAWIRGRLADNGCGRRCWSIRRRGGWLLGQGERAGESNDSKDEHWLASELEDHG